MPPTLRVFNSAQSSASYLALPSAHPSGGYPLCPPHQEHSPIPTHSLAERFAPTLDWLLCITVRYCFFAQSIHSFFVRIALNRFTFIVFVFNGMWPVQQKLWRSCVNVYSFLLHFWADYGCKIIDESIVAVSHISKLSFPSFSWFWIITDQLPERRKQSPK